MNNGDQKNACQMEQDDGRQVRVRSSFLKWIRISKKCNLHVNVIE